MCLSPQQSALGLGKERDVFFHEERRRKKKWSDFGKLYTLLSIEMCTALRQGGFLIHLYPTSNT